MVGASVPRRDWRLDGSDPRQRDHRSFHEVRSVLPTADDRLDSQAPLARGSRTAGHTGLLLPPRNAPEGIRMRSLRRAVPVIQVTGKVEPPNFAYLDSSRKGLRDQ